MSGGAAFEDMNATPLGKLPAPPIMQSKSDAPRIDDATGTSYADILKGMSAGQQQAAGQQAHPATMHPATMHPATMHHPVAAALQVQPQMSDRTLAQPVHQYTTQPVIQSEPMHHQVQYHSRDLNRRTSLRKPRGEQRQRCQRRQQGQQRQQRRPRGSSVSEALFKYRNALVVVVIVFAVLRWVSPRLLTIPRLASLDGHRLNVPGLLILACLCGGIYRAAEHAIARMG